MNHEQKVIAEARSRERKIQREQRRERQASTNDPCKGKAQKTDKDRKRVELGL